MANFGNVQNLPFAFFLLPPSIISKRGVPGQRSGSKASSERYQVPTKVRVNLTNGRGKIKWQILVTCKICHLPFFPCRQALFLKDEFSGNAPGAKRCRKGRGQSTARVVGEDGLLPGGGVDVGVDLGGGDALVAEHILDDT